MGCQQQKGGNSFHINGNIGDAEDGTIVMLQLDKEQSMEIIQQTEVKNHRFSFNGTADTVLECNITYLVKGNPIGASFFLESGEIVMDLSNETSSIKGTPNNDLYQKFLNRINAIYAQIGSAYNEMPEDSLHNHNAQETTLNDKVNTLNRKANELIFTTIEENINNPVGYHLFCRFYENLSAEQQEKIINSLPLHFRRSSTVEDIRSQLSILPPSSENTDSLYYEEFD